MISGTNLKTRVESDAVMYWANEVQSYDFTRDTCISGAVCGHFTQIIWSSTRRIGCAKSTRKKGNITSIYIVCQYDPAGNIV